MTAKLSVSLSDDDAKFIDALALQHGGNRSAAIQDLVRLGREMNAVEEYAGAYAEWEETEEAQAWDTTSSDGLGAGDA